MAHTNFPLNEFKQKMNISEEKTQKDRTSGMKIGQKSYTNA